MFLRLLDKARRLRMKVIKPLGRGRGPDFATVSLCDTDAEIARTLADRFRDVDGVEVLVGSLFDLDSDALVTPANSFGDMSGGLDQQVDRFYDGAAQRAIMDRIAERFHGELPVGQATILDMRTRRFPFLVVAPTMRVPGRISETINAYLAMRAALAAILDHNNGAGPNRIESVAIPGLGTGVGAMPAEMAAVQMRAAYDMIALGGWRQIVHPIQAPFALGLDFKPKARKRPEGP